MASQKKGFLQVILLLAVALVGHYCGTSLPAWSICAKGLVEVSDSAMRPLCGWRKPRSCSFCWRSCLSCGRRSAACRRQRPRWPQKTGPWKALVPPSTRRELRRPTAAERIRAAGLWRCSFHPNLLMLFCSRMCPQETAGLSRGTRARWSSGCQYESVPLPSLCSTSTKRCLHLGASPAPPETSLSS
ncbi:unnamed protein product, partial [Bubo scandiacus]